MKNNNHFYYLECVSCHKKTNENETTSRCLSCRGPLDVVYDYEQLKLQLNAYLLKNTPPKVMKYLDFYPLLKRQELFSLDEGGTSLHWAKHLEKKVGVRKLLIKNEGLNPTGAFKDRGSFVEINKAAELGFKSVCVASTGNMAASVAAYAAQAGMECLVFVPEGTSKSKLAQCLSYGAKVIQVSGTYSDTNILAQETAKKYGFYLAGDYVFRSEGQKSAGFELAEQMWWQNIDNVYVEVKNFIGNKGKTIAKADLQSILETVIQQESKKNYLELVDFHIQDSKKKRPQAEVAVKLNGKHYTSESEGVGPVDAAITAIRRVIDKYDGIDFRLTDFTVEIPTTGSDATVEVTMVLREKSGTQVVEKGTSPDIIVASMEAFVRGYNELVYQLKERPADAKAMVGKSR